jgi:hypothetical protein
MIGTAAQPSTPSCLGMFTGCSPPADSLLATAEARTAEFARSFDVIALTRVRGMFQHENHFMPYRRVDHSVPDRGSSLSWIIGLRFAPVRNSKPQLEN